VRRHFLRLAAPTQFELAYNMSRQLALPDMASESEGLSLGSYLSAKEVWSVVQLRSALERSNPSHFLQ